jgi:hypothetical protein
MEVAMAYLRALSKDLLGEPEVCYENLDGESRVNKQLLRKFFTFRWVMSATGPRGSVVVEALCYRPEVCGIASR